MSGYIFKPPPAPPPPPQTQQQPTVHSLTGTRFNKKNPRDGAGGRRIHYPKNSGDQHNRERDGGRGGGSQRCYQKPPPHRYQSFQAPQQMPSQFCAPAPHLNPAFLPQFHQQAQQQYQHQQQNHLTPSQQLLSIHPAQFQLPSVNTTLQPSLHNPFFSQWAPNSSQSSSAQYVLPHSPPLKSYADITPVSAPASYAQFSAPTQKPASKMKATKPDMSHEEWLALNGGKILGTDIQPPETEDEIAAWIAERKKRFPISKKKMDGERKKKEQTRQGVEEAKRTLYKKSHEKLLNEEVETEQIKRTTGKSLRNGRRKTENGGGDNNSDSDQAPEEISAHTRHVFRVDNKKRPALKTNPKLTLQCLDHQANYVLREDQIRSRATKKKNGTNDHSKQAKIRPSLYHRLVGNEIDCENELILDVIKCFAEWGALQGMKESAVAVEGEGQDEDTDEENQKSDDDGEAMNDIHVKEY